MSFGKGKNYEGACLRLGHIVLIAGCLISLPGLTQETLPTPQPASPTLAEESVAKPTPDQILLPEFRLVDNPTLPGRIIDLLNNHVTVFNRPPENTTLAELRLLRFAVRRQIASILATEGYFSPVVKFINEFKNQEASSIPNQRQVQNVVVQVNVDLGLPTKIADVQLSFEDDVVPIELQQSIKKKWSLPKEARFRDEDWSQAKAHAIETLVENGYAAAKISHSEAVIQNQQADLIVAIDSGPIFRIGELRITGFTKYGAWLLDRYKPPAQGDIYNQANLIKFQSGLQNSPYFSAANVSIEPNPEMANAATVDVLLQERKEYDIGLAAGYSTNTRARGEISFQDRDFFQDAWNLKSALRIEQLRQIGYADIYLPPNSDGDLDSFGVLFKRTDIEGLVTRTSSVGVKRVFTENSVEKRLGLAFIYEHSTINDGGDTFSKALVPSIGRTWHAVDNPFDPRRGRVTQLDLSGAAKLAISDQNFLRVYGKHQQWIPVNIGHSRDVIILRAEGGYVLAPDDAGIPEDLLFRAGGTGSVRGYAYQSLGVDQGGSVVGGRILATASAEYIHWLKGKWGVAGFVDIGDAADRFTDLKMKQGVGIGVRYKTPAGPIAVDLAYGLQAKKVRLDFFIGIAF